MNFQLYPQRLTRPLYALLALLTAVTALSVHSPKASAQSGSIKEIPFYGPKSIFRDQSSPGTWMDINNDRRVDYLFRTVNPQYGNYQVKVAYNLPGIQIGDSVRTLFVMADNPLGFRRTRTNADAEPDLLVRGYSYTHRLQRNGDTFTRYDSIQGTNIQCYDGDGDGDDDIFRVSYDPNLNQSAVEYIQNSGLGATSNPETLVQFNKAPNRNSSGVGYSVVKVGQDPFAAIITHYTFYDTLTWARTDTNIVYRKVGNTYVVHSGFKGRVAGFGTSFENIDNLAQPKDLNSDGLADLNSGEGFAFQRANGSFAYSIKNYRRQLLGTADPNSPVAYFFAFSPTLPGQQLIQWYIKATVDSAIVEGRQARYLNADSTLIKLRGVYTFEDIDGDGDRDLIEFISDPRGNFNSPEGIPSVNWRRSLARNMTFGRAQGLLEFKTNLTLLPVKNGGMLAYSHTSIFYLPRSTSDSAQVPIRLFGPRQLFGAPGSPQVIFDVRVADANSDGVEDVIAYGDSGVAVISMTPGVAPILYPQFRSSWNTPLPAVADLNGDRLPDFIEQNSTWFRTHLGTAPGQLAAPFNTLPVQTIVNGVLQVQRGINSVQAFGPRGQSYNWISDFDGDGILDLTVNDINGSTGYFYAPGLGNGRFLNRYIPFSNVAQRINSNSYSQIIAIKDLNRDRRVDLLSLSINYTTQKYFYKIYFQTGAEQWDTVNVPTAPGQNITFLGQADMNADSLLDIVFTDNVNYTVWLASQASTYDTALTIYNGPTQALPYTELINNSSVANITRNASPEFVTTASANLINGPQVLYGGFTPSRTMSVQGTVFLETLANANCIKDSAEAGVYATYGWNVRLEPGGLTAPVDYYGSYSIVCDTSVRSVSLITPAGTLYSVCPPVDLGTSRPGRTAVVNLGAVNTALTIQGSVFLDNAIANCVKDPGEIGQVGWTIQAQPGGYVAYTDGNGNYTLVCDTNVRSITAISQNPGSTYRACLPVNIASSLPGQQIEVNLGVKNTGVTILGTIFEESSTTSNCFRDPGEVGAAGRIVRAEPGGYVAYSDFYGNYTIAADSNVRTVFIDSSNNNSALFNLCPPQTFTAPRPGSQIEVNLGIVNKAITITGNVFKEEPSSVNCIKDFAEAGVFNWLVVAQPGNYTAYTDFLGNYTLLADSRVRTVYIQSQAGNLFSTCPPRNIDSAQQGTQITADFGIVDKSITIRGNVFSEDISNANCTKDPAEGGMAGWFVRADPGNYLAFTDSQGNYTMQADTGVQTVSAILPATNNSNLLYNLCPPRSIVNSRPGSVVEANLGIVNKSVTIQGIVYKESNANFNCIKDTADIGMYGWLVRAEPGGYIATTDRQGRYSMVCDSNVRIVSVDRDSYANIVNLCPPKSIGTNTPGTRVEANFGTSVIDCFNLKGTVEGGSFAILNVVHPMIVVENTGTQTSPPPVAILQLPARTRFSNYWTRAWGMVDTTLLDTLPGNRIRVRFRDSLRAGQTVSYMIGIEADQDPALINQTLCMRLRVTPQPDCYGPTSPNSRTAANLEITSACNGNEGRFVVYNNGGVMSDSANYELFAQNGFRNTGKLMVRPNDSIAFLPTTLGLLPGLPSHMVVRQDASTGAVYTAASLENCRSQNGITPGFLGGLPGTEPSSISVICWPVTSSYDPNDKAVTPAGAGLDKNVPVDGLLRYRIRFENEGSDIAYKVVVLDTLDANLDIATFRVQGYSHPMTHTIRRAEDGRAIARFEFANIRLPYKAQDSLRSQGQFSFTIRPKAAAGVGTRITNTAHIYFDINPAIVTNTVLSTLSVDAVLEPTAMAANLVSGANLRLSPNPASSVLSVRVSGQPTNFVPSIHITDAAGRVVIAKALMEGNNFSINDLPAGIYMLEATTAKGPKLRARFAKQ
jgi:hypothetical protein